MITDVVCWYDFDEAQETVYPSPMSFMVKCEGEEVISFNVSCAMKKHVEDMKNAPKLPMMINGVIVDEKKKST